MQDHRRWLQEGPIHQWGEGIEPPPIDHFVQQCIGITTYLHISTLDTSAADDRGDVLVG